MKTSVVIVATTLTLAACSQDFAKEEQDLANPASCATAEGDIRVLKNEKAHVDQEMASGIFIVVPAAVVVGVLSGTQEERLEMASGEYNAKIDAKIAEIEGTCGL
jgi:hypothetical protein